MMAPRKMSVPKYAHPAPASTKRSPAPKIAALVVRSSGVACMIYPATSRFSLATPVSCGSPVVMVPAKLPAASCRIIEAVWSIV